MSGEGHAGGGVPGVGAPGTPRAAARDRGEPTDQGVADVVVVGAGPVGLLLASELALHRVAVTVVERLPGVVDQPKAGTLHARAAQQLRRRGLLPTGPLGGDPDAVARDAFHFAAQLRFPVESPLAEGLPIVGRWQGELERLLEAVCRSRAVTILREHEVTAVEQDARGARVEVAGAGRSRTIHASWVVGADGARSIVRRAAGIDTVDRPATMRSLLARVTLDDPARAPAGWHEWPGGWTLLNLNPEGPSRLITFEFGAEHADRAAPVTAEEVETTTRRVTGGRAIPFHDLAFSGRFSDFSRLATDYRRGRLLLAGDAAHVHFPVGGQGLNLGLQDAFNLGWKLAMVVRGSADPALLDSYAAERQPHAERVIAYTRDQAAAMSTLPSGAAERTRLLAEASTPAAQRALGLAISSQAQRTDPGLQAAPHPLAGRFATDRALPTAAGTVRLAALLAGGRALLIERTPEGLAGSAVVAELVAGWAGRIEHVVEETPARDAGKVTGRVPVQPTPPAAAAETPAALVLIRPDGYVAWAAAATDATDLHGLATALGRWLGPADRARAAVRAAA